MTDKSVKGVLKRDVIIIKFVKLWDFSGYYERTSSERPTRQKLAFQVTIFSS